MTGPRKNGKRKSALQILIWSRNVSQKDLAIAIGLNKSRVSKLCAGSKPRLDEAQKIAAFLKCPIESLQGDPFAALPSSEKCARGLQKFFNGPEGQRAAEDMYFMAKRLVAVVEAER